MCDNQKLDVPELLRNGRIMIDEESVLDGIGRLADVQCHETPNQFF
jgi:hypothetical protein